MHSRALKAVIIVEIISAMFGFWGGVPLSVDPSGRILGLQTNLIASLPIKNFISPGIWLLLVYGCGCSQLELLQNILMNGKRASLKE